MSLRVPNSTLAGAAIRILPVSLVLALALPAIAGEAPEAVRPGELGSKVYRLERKGEQDAVVDGDTIRLADLPARVRLVCVDTEEVFRDDTDEDAARKDFAAYSEKKQGDSPQPVKYATPAGMLASQFAHQFFEGVEQALLVPDDPEQLTGYYGRTLGYLLVDRDGDGAFEDNFNLALVEHGMSPYFVKYGRSLLWDRSFVAAEARARAAQLGIWDPDPPRGAEHYPDYEARLEWWRLRADCLDHFKARHASEPGMIRLGIDSTLDSLAAMVGKEVTLFGSLYVSRRDGKITGLSLSHRRGMDVHLEGEQLAADLALLDQCDGQYVYVRGRLVEIEGKGYRLEVDGAGNLWLEPPGTSVEPGAGDETR